MRSPVFILILSVIFILFGGINYYIGLRGWQTVFSHISWVNGKVYWTVFWVLALSYLIARVGERFLPVALSRGLVQIGAYWLAAMFYFILIWLFVDIIRILGTWAHFLPAGFKGNMTIGVFVFVAVVLLLVYGTYNARNPRVHHYDVTISKKADQIKDLHVVMVSDVHLGTIIHGGRLARMVDMINEQEPDLVLFAGDVIDEDVDYFIEKKMSDYFRKIKSKYGVYAVLGNHEYIGGHAEAAVKGLSEAGITVLKDQTIKVADAFYVAGRDDLSSDRFTNSKRKPLTEVLNNVDKKLPILLLDHQPSRLEESQAQGVDLQLSGHTHVGQMFPNNLITDKIYEVDWGYLRKGPFQVIVSSGYGTWGPPIRIGNYPEIVDINLKFAE